MGDRSTSRPDRPTHRLAWWVLLEGNRLVVAGGAVVGVFAFTLVLVRAGAIAVGPNSSMGSVATSAIAGLLTLITVTLTINQLILSRVFGTPGQLRDELDGNRRFRRSVADLAGRPSTPNEPAAFAAVVGEALHDRATTLRAAISDAALREPTGDADGEGDGGGGGEAFADGLDAVVGQAAELRDIDAEETSAVDVLGTFLGPRNARNLRTIDRLREVRADRLSDEARDALDDVERLLEDVAIVRQFYKTLVLQQTLAKLSRLVAYVGFLSLVASIYVALVYRTNGTATIGPRYLSLVASAGVAASVAPLAVLLSYVLRVATISRYTLSVGSFVPPKERLGKR